MALGEAFWEQRGRLGGSDKAMADIFCHLHHQWLDDSDDCQALLWTADDQMSCCKKAFCELAQAMPDDDAAQEEAFQALFQRYRHLFLRGQPLAEWQDICCLEEDESKARAELRVCLRDDGPSFPERSELGETERNLAEQRALGRLGKVRRIVYRHALNVARRYAHLGIDLDEPVLLSRLLERDVVYEVGHRLQTQGLVSSPDEACLLGFREIIDWLEGTTQDDELACMIAQRKDQTRRWWRYAPPNILSDKLQSPEVELDISTSSEDILHGQPISSGSARGPARIVKTLGETTNVLPGEILVCHEPLFELSPLFRIISAIVAETGGLQDHAGVLAREYGVPAIFGVQDATKAVRTGEDLQVEASNGVIVRHRRKP